MAAFDRSDDLALALQSATDLMAGKRFAALAEVLGDVAAAERVVEVAEVFVAWMRRPVSAQLGTPTIEEIP